MPESFLFENPDLCTVGTVGPKGRRVFYLQCREDDRLVTLKLEKQQVAALAEYLDQVLDDLPERPVGDPPDDLTLRDPVIAAWAVGALGVAYVAEVDRVLLVAEELVTDEADEDATPASLRAALTREQVVGLIQRSRHLVAAGRAPCPWCARPLDPAADGWCPCQN
ncbi:MAG: DUF3090 family protein [Actinomyces sp.]|nr:MAG: DUF3090 family protein [Actinomyces sp.]